MSSYESLSTAKAAFIVGRTEFRRSDEVYIVLVTKNGEPVGHEMVQVVDVVGITGDGQPVYSCLRAAGPVQNFDGTQLHRAPTPSKPYEVDQLLYTPDGSQSVYGKWWFAEQDRMRASALIAPPPPQEVTAVIDF